MLKKRILQFVAILAALLMLAGCGTEGLSASANISSDDGDYSYAVKCIMSEDYEEAVETLKQLDEDDSGALYLYAYYQSQINSYNGNPGKMLEDISFAEEDITNEEVLHQCENAKEEIALAESIQGKIDSIDTSSASAISTSLLEEIADQAENLSDRYFALLKTDNYSAAINLLESAESSAAVEDEAGQEALAAEAYAAQENEVMVWIPKSGSKYHSKSSCSNMKNPTQVTLEQAEAWGYEACKKCW